MSGKTRILYTIAKYDPRLVAVNDEKIVDVHEHYDLIKVLSKDGANRYNNVLLSMVRYLIDNMDANGNIKCKEITKIADAFIGIDYGDIEDANTLHLVERVLVGDEIYYEPINLWTVDVRVLKAVLMRKLVHAGMNDDDLNEIIYKYGLEQYYSSVKVGGVDDSEKISFVNRYNHYLFEFYMRSNDPDPWMLNSYFDNARIQAMLGVYRKHSSNTEIIFSHELSLRGTLEQEKENIKDFCENIIHYTKRMYELHYPEDYFKSWSKGGNGHYSVQFVKCQRYIRIYDLYKEYEKARITITDGRLDAIGKKIVAEFDVHKDYSPSDLRDEIRKGLNNAKELIEHSTQGFLPYPIP